VRVLSLRAWPRRKQQNWREEAASNPSSKQGRETAAPDKMTDRKPQERRIARRPNGSSEARREPGGSPTPYLAELRRRAAARLRELSLALETVRREYGDAAAECERLQAPCPAETPDASAVARDAPIDAPAASGPTAGSDEIEHLLSRVEALAEKLSQAEEALASEREQRRQVEETAEELERRFTASEERLMEEQARVTALTERARELAARLESVQSRDADRHEGSMEAARERLSVLEADVKSTRAVSVRLRAEMTQLLTFLDELNGILAAAAR
jgi:vacuolar-type H+-ATPase subunit I/STV1